MNFSSRDWAGIERIFFGALDRPPQEREAWVEEAAAGDAGLEEQVRSLLGPTTRPRRRRTPQPAGPYRLERILGRGGMGEVWLASRADQQYEKKVAIKLVRPGISGGDLISASWPSARFWRTWKAISTESRCGRWQRHPRSAIVRRSRFRRHMPLPHGAAGKRCRGDLALHRTQVRAAARNRRRPGRIVADFAAGRAGGHAVAGPHGAA